MKIKKKIYSFIRKLECDNIKDSFNYLTSKSPLIYYYDYEQNWGDSVNEFIFESILGERVYSKNRIFNFTNQECITGIGSILSNKLINYSIWGSGFLSENHSLVHAPNSLLAIRGSHSLKKIKSAFGISTDLLGDPGLLFKEFYNPKIDRNYPLGIIPHFKELNEQILIDIKLNFGDDVNIISPTLDIFEFADQVLKCERILSSSLHGLILAESYGIPTARIVVSDKMLGGDFKFMDYYSGVGVKFEKTSSYLLKDLWDSNSLISVQCDLKDLSYDKENLILSLKNKFNNS